MQEKHAAKTYLSRLFLRNSPELEHHARPPPTGDLYAAAGGVFWKKMESWN